MGKAAGFDQGYIQDSWAGGDIIVRALMDCFMRYLKEGKTPKIWEKVLNFINTEKR